ncbi:MAG: DUF2179 domain-containing protein [Phycisphaerae bacterium]|nr:DUF2179 domain-containing protein [Phycisphaerae bacterium]
MMTDVSLVDSAWLPALIFVARITDVSLGTFRIICVTRGQRTAAVILGFFEISIWVFAISSVFAHLDRWENIIAFAGGFTVGNALGMWLEGRLAMGVQVLTLISKGSAQAVAECLRYAGYVVTTLNGRGRDGPVALCMVVVARRQSRAVIRLARQVDPDVHSTVEDVRESTTSITALGGGKVPLSISSLLRPALRGLAASSGRRVGRLVDAPTRTVESPTLPSDDRARRCA